ncbi:MAG: hypothetical protein IH624_05190 [Phycisphaerae bacterium]|nr:hypothetical protein [Phycisphaerae bacterium]
MEYDFADPSLTYQMLFRPEAQPQADVVFRFLSPNQTDRSASVVRFHVPPNTDGSSIESWKDNPNTRELLERIRSGCGRWDRDNKNYKLDKDAQEARDELQESLNALPKLEKGGILAKDYFADMNLEQRYFSYLPDAAKEWHIDEMMDKIELAAKKSGYIVYGLRPYVRVHLEDYYRWNNNASQ